MENPDIVNPEAAIAELVGTYATDPLGFVMAAFPWGSDPRYSLVKLKEPWVSRYNAVYGPDEWACLMLDEIGRQCRQNDFDGAMAVDPIRIAVASGHGIGKSFTTGLLLWWILSTRPFCKGTVTANTMGQLSTKTWAQFASMQDACLTGHWFEINTAKGSMRAYHKEFPQEWFVSAQTSKEENSEAFAGQHAANSTSFYLFDEASGIPDKIWEVAEGGLTDGEPMIFAFGNPTRNVGQFYNCFHRDRNRWTTYKVDSREAQLTNKKQIEEWREAYGEDSDFFKVRVLGEFPATSTAQLIPTDAVDDAMMREKPGADPSSFAQAIVGLDVARFGDDATVLCTRVGSDCVSIPWQTMRGMDGKQVGERAHAHAQMLLDDYGFQIVRINFDRAGIGAAVDEYFRYNNMDPRIRVNAVDFSMSSRWPLRYLNKRAEMWSLMKDWLVKKDGVIPKDEELKEQLIAPEYMFTPKGQIQLEAKKDIKKRLGVSPDRADALCLTFAEPAAEINNKVREARAKMQRQSRDADPFKGLRSKQ